VAAIKARKCFFPASSWVHAFILTCDDKLAVWFKRGSRRYHGHTLGGVPGVCCLYPQSNQGLYNLATVWGSPGKFVWRFLYKKLGYQLVKPPVTPCAGCATAVGVTSSEDPSNFGDAVTFTATVTDSDGSDTPQGAVEFFDGLTDLGAGSALSGSGASATSTFTTSSLAVGTHTITAKFTAKAGAGFQNAQGSLTQTVNSNNVTQCGCSLPQTLHVTFTNGVSGTYALTWNGTTAWSTPNPGGPTICGGVTSPVTLQCVGNQWELVVSQTNGGCGAGAFASSASCSPLNVVFNLTGSLPGNCCNGQSFTATVTT